LETQINELTELAEKQDVVGIKAKLKEIVPEYTPFELNDGR
jgi:hypothetical protein